HGARKAPYLSRCCTRRRQDVRHAQRGQASPGARHGCRRGTGRNARSGQHRGADRRPRSCSTPADRLPRHRFRGNGRRRRPRPEGTDASLANYFRPGNLAALRELALLWVADKVDESLQGYMDEHGIRGPWETRERVVVAITGAPGGDGLIRRAARMAMRAHAELLGVHVRSTDGLAGPPKQLLDEHRALLNELGGAYHEIVGDDVGKALIEFARAENATQLLLGASRRSRWAELTRGSVIN